MTAEFSCSLGIIVAQLGGELKGDASYQVAAIQALAKAKPQTISFVAQEKYLPELAQSTAGCVILKPQWQDKLAPTANAILTDNPYLYYARLSSWWQQQQQRNSAATLLIHPTACIDPSAELAADVRVGAFSYIGAGAKIAAGVVIATHCTIERQAVIGRNTKFLGQVYIGERCQLGADCLLQPGVVIGGDGFGYAPHQGSWVKIAQLGRVIIGDRVEIGANSCVDRGAIDDTIIEDGVILDNLIQIAHNVKVGANTAMASGVGVAGSTTIGKNCTIGGASGIGGHLTIVDNTHIAAATNIPRSINQPGEYCGLYPFEEKRSWYKNAALIRHLSSLRQRLIKLEKQLTSTKNND